MTWRRFVGLIRGLSPLSAFLNAQGAQDATTRPDNDPELITDTAEGERAVLSLMAGG